MSIAEKTICIIACHTNSDLKIWALLHNIKYFLEISDKIIVINSIEFEKSDISHKIKEEYKDDIERIEFQYHENTNLLGQKKWYDCLNNINTGEHTYFILTNDSFLLTRSINDFKNIFSANIEMVGIIESHEEKHHYPDFLRCYNRNGITKLLNFHKIINETLDVNNITCLDVVFEYEIKSTSIFRTKKVLYTSNYNKNLHFEDEESKKYLYERNYPIIKIKKLQTTKYDLENHSTLPNDFNSDKYKLLNPDLQSLDDEQLKQHFLRFGMKESRKYSKSQLCILPDYLNVIIQKIKEKKYINKPIPYDFNFEKYKSLNPDLNHMNKDEVIYHFLNYGIYEGRIYK